MALSEAFVRAKNRLNKTRMFSPPTFELSQEVIDAVEQRAADAGKPVYQIRPYVEEGGVREAIPLINDLHEFERGWVRDKTPTTAFEPWFVDGALTFNIVPGNAKLGRRVRDQLYEDYPHSEIRQRMSLFPPMEAGQYMAGATLSQFRSSHLPIRHVDIDGFGDGGSGVRDPFKNVLTRVTGNDDATVMVQSAFRPRRMNYFYRRAMSKASRKLEAEEWKIDLLPYPRKVKSVPDEIDKTAAEVIRAQGDEDLFELCTRLLVVADDRATAENRLKELARSMSQYYESHVHQGFYARPALQYQRFLARCADRSVPGGRRKAKVTATELAGKVHLPAPGVNNPAIDVSHSKTGNPVPPRTPRFDFEAVGIEDPELATPQERFRTMLRHGHETPGNSDDAIWIGEGARGGTEAGIPVEDLLHLAITGMSGYGKSKEALNIFYQLAERGATLFYGDPKDGSDAALAVALAMLAGRGDDVIPIRVGADTDHQVTFNFLEVPGDAEPGTPEYVDKLEPMADVVEGVLDQASGTTDAKWGTRMSRITRHMVRGLGQLDLDTPPTLMSMNYAGATETDREEYAEFVDEQNIPFLKDTAKSVFAEYDSNAIEPWAGRVNQVVESGPLREVACNPHGFSLSDAVREGKIIVLFGETASDTALKMLMTALVPSLWTVKQELVHDEDEPETPPLHLFVDELNDIVTPRMDLPQILSNSRSYDMHLHGIFQDPDSQVGDDVAKAFEGQADTLSVNPGTEAFANSLKHHHSGDVGKQELLDLPKFRQYVRTHDNTGEKTRSYPVNLGHPIAEIDDEVPTPEEALALVEEREREIGHEKRSPEQIKADDPFATADAVDSDVDELTVTDAVERAAVQGVYDTACRAGDPSGYVPLADAADAVIRRVERLQETPNDTADRLDTGGDLWRRVLQHVGDDILSVREKDGETLLQATTPRSTLATVGDDQSAGGAGHGLLMWDSYQPLAWAGLDVTIQDASGDDADGLARPAPPEEQNAPELVECLTGGSEARIESEHSTGSTKAGMTAQHVLQAANEGRRAIVLARPGIADNVADTLTEPPVYCRSDRGVGGETRYYTSPRDLRIDGEPMTRPGSRENVWVQEESGDIVLRDDAGTEHARFDSVEAVFTDSNPYPSGGENNIKYPIIPEWLLEENAEPSAEIVTVPEDTESLADLSLVVDGMTVPADTIGTGPDAEDTVNVDDLDVRDGAADLFRALRDDGVETVTVSEAAGYSDASRRSVVNYLGDLVDAGVVRRERTPGTSADLFHL